LHWELLDRDDDLADMLADAAGHTRVAVDTEFMRRNTFFPQAALLQLCFDSTAWLIDPLAIDDLSPIIDIMQDPGIVKVLHSASEDLEVFQDWLGVLPQPLFDTQKAAAMVGRGFGMGYRALVMEIEGVDLPKGETRSDWLARPLTDSQCDYAALDVTHLLTAWEELDAQCSSQGKGEWVLDDGAVATASLASTAVDYHKRIKSAWKLAPRQLAILIAVCDWRERTARSKNKPRSWIIDDQACMQLALHSPGTVAEMRSALGLPATALRRYGDELLELLDVQSKLPQTELPAKLGKPLTPAQRNQIKVLKRSVKEIALERTITPEVLLSGKDYELLVREASGERITPPLSWGGWRAQLVVEPLRAQLQGPEQ
jgi:ribonuclease D